MTNNHRGQRVIAKGYGDKLLKLIVWEVGERVVYLCSEGQYDRLFHGKQAPPPIGFPKADVMSEADEKNLPLQHA